MRAGKGFQIRSPNAKAGAENPDLLPKGEFTQLGSLIETAVGIVVDQDDDELGMRDIRIDLQGAHGGEATRRLVEETQVELLLQDALELFSHMGEYRLHRLVIAAQLLVEPANVRVESELDLHQAEGDHVATLTTWDPPEYAHKIEPFLQSSVVINL